MVNNAKARRTAFDEHGYDFEKLWGIVPHGFVRKYPRIINLGWSLWGIIFYFLGALYPIALRVSTPKY